MNNLKKVLFALMLVGISVNADLRAMEDAPVAAPVVDEAALGERFNINIIDRGEDFLVLTFNMNHGYTEVAFPKVDADGNQTQNVRLDVDADDNPVIVVTGVDKAVNFAPAELGLTFDAEQPGRRVEILQALSDKLGVSVNAALNFAKKEPGIAACMIGVPVALLSATLFPCVVTVGAFGAADLALKGTALYGIYRGAKVAFNGTKNLANRGVRHFRRPAAQ